MYKFFPIFLCCILLIENADAQIFRTNAGVISFFSHTPALDIEATSKEAGCIIDISKKQLAVAVKNNSFKFKNSLMEEHFNEKYMESEKYPNSTFAGTIQEAVSFTQPGEYKVTVKGKLTIHGVSQERTITGILTIVNGKVNIKSEFLVKTADHKIEIPKLVFQDIAEEIKVNLDATIPTK